MAESQPPCTAQRSLICAACNSTFKDPKVLQCFHVCCKDCILQLIQDNQNELFLNCPICHHPTFLLEGSSVSDLQPAFHIDHILKTQEALSIASDPQSALCGKCTKSQKQATSYCRDCSEFICAMCTDIHKEWESFATHKVIELGQLKHHTDCTLMKVELCCSQHRGKQLELYCETCEQLICHNCTVSAHCRPEHCFRLVDDAYEKYKEEIAESLQPIERQLTLVSKTLTKLDQHSQDVANKRAVTEAEINKLFTQVSKALEQRKAHLIKQVDQYTTQKVQKQKHAVEKVKSQLVSCLSFVRDSLQTESRGEIVSMKKIVIKQIKEITDNFKPEELPSSFNSVDVKITATVAETIQSIQRFGKLYMNLASPKKCYATGQGIAIAEPCETTTAVLHITDLHGKPCSVHREAISCVLLSDSSSTEENKCSLKKITMSLYEISYRLTARGKYQLHIKVEGENIRGSPFAIMAKTPLEKLSSPFLTISGMKTPWGVAVSQTSNIVVAEVNGHCISIISSDGKRIQTFGSRGSKRGQFRKPYGVALDSKDNILVADSGNNRIQKFSFDGKFVSAVGKVGTKQLEFQNPLSLALSPTSQKILIVDNVNNRIQILNLDLTFLNFIGSYGSGQGQFVDPYDVACDSKGNIFVADTGNNRIQVFNEHGDFIRQFNRKGSDQGELISPCGVTIDCNDVVYVTELNRPCVSVYSYEGEHRKSFGAQFNEPRRIVVDNKGVIYVSDFKNNCIQLF